SITRSLRPSVSHSAANCPSVTADTATHLPSPDSYTFDGAPRGVLLPARPGGGTPAATAAVRQPSVVRIDSARDASITAPRPLPATSRANSAAVAAYAARDPVR